MKSLVGILLLFIDSSKRKYGSRVILIDPEDNFDIMNQISMRSLSPEEKKNFPCFLILGNSTIKKGSGADKTRRGERMVGPPSDLCDQMVFLFREGMIMLCKVLGADARKNRTAVKRGHKR